MISIFLKYLSGEKRYSALTVSSYSSDLNQFADYIKSQYHEDISNSQNEMVRSWMAQLIHNGMHPNSIHRKVSSLSAFFRYCMISGQRNDNPCAGIRKPKRPSRLPQFLDAQSIMQLYRIIDQLATLSDFPSIRDSLLLRLLIETGMRRAEIIDLKLSDVDESYRQLRITGKRRKVRIMPISDELLRLIRQYKTCRDQFQNIPLPENLLLNDSSKKMSTIFVYHKVHAYLSQVTTIQKKSPHVMRHSFATGLLNNGAQLQAIKELLGHTNLAATQVYTHNGIAKLQQIHRNKHPRA